MSANGDTYDVAMRSPAPMLDPRVLTRLAR